MEKIRRFFDRNFFISVVGKSGSGKSTLVKNIIEQLYGDAFVAVLAAKPWGLEGIRNFTDSRLFLELASDLIFMDRVKVFIVDDALNMLTMRDVDKLKEMLYVVRAFKYKFIMLFQDVSNDVAKELIRMSNGIILFNMEYRAKLAVQRAIGVKFSFPAKRYAAYFIDDVEQFMEDLEGRLKVYRDEGDPVAMLVRAIRGMSLTMAIKHLMRFGLSNSKMFEILSMAGFNTTPYSVKTIKSRVRRQLLIHA